MGSPAKTDRAPGRGGARVEPASNDNSAASPIPPGDRAFLQAVARLAFANPFAPEHAEAVRDALGDDAADAGRIAARLGPVLDCIRGKLAAGAAASDADLALYEDACFYALCEAHGGGLQEIVEGRTAALYRALAGEHERLLGFAAIRGRVWWAPPEHVFACCSQVRRAHPMIASTLIGSNRPVAELRADVWRSIFTDDLRAYVRGLHDRMDEVATLVTGPTGTGKDLVARAIGLTRYAPFDSPRLRFTVRPDEGYHPLNLAALSPSLIESELFGHVRGAFTGAVEAQRGWLSCGPGETLFLDEVGELAEATQVKLLRVLQTGDFSPIGSRERDRFSGKLVAATHRDLRARIREGAFREDLFWRISSDWIVTPSLREQLDDTPEDLHLYTRFIADKVAGPARGAALAEKVLRWIGDNLSPDHPWPGNVRELEVYVRSAMMRGRCRPPAARPAAVEDPFRAILERKLSLEEAMQRYVTIVHAETNSISETARRLGMDRHVLAAKLDRALLERLKRRRRGQ